MPKLKPSEQEQQNMNTRAVIAYCQERTGVTDEELAKLSWKISHHGVANREQLSHLKTSMTKT